MIRFQDVSKEFSPNDFGVKEVSFVVDAGEFVFITGSSGSGKTTLMRLIIREYTPTSGQISLFDEKLETLPQKKVAELRRKVGVVFQDYKLLPELNVWENIALPLEIAGQPQAEIEHRVTDLLKLIGLLEKPYLFPSQLSGGEAQRVGIARALSLGPELIFADEPTGNLDADNTRAIVELLKKINELGTTILFATHDLKLTKQGSPRVLKLENGTLVQDTKPKATQPTKAAVVKTEEPPKEAVKPKETVELKKNPVKKSWLSSLFSKKEPTPKTKKPAKQKEQTKKPTKQIVTSEENLE